MRKYHLKPPMLQNARYSRTLSTERKIGQMLVAGFHGLEPPDHILRWLENGRIGGVILFARNIDNPEQVAELTRVCHEAAARPILVAMDQEGGRRGPSAGGVHREPGCDGPRSG